MGSGKSKLGPLLAKRLGWAFEDLDALIQADAGLSVAQVFSRFGEAHFRTLERRVLETVSEIPKPVVVALGGGAYMSKQNRALLRSSGTTVWLDVPLVVLSRRLARRTHRPLLLGGDGKTLQGDALLAKITELLEPRRPAYAQADVQFIWTADRSPNEMVALLFEQLREHGAV
ncbi:MAG: shikimate kinase [Rhodothermales bacterium]|jgi:shikimate kinase